MEPQNLPLDFGSINDYLFQKYETKNNYISDDDYYNLEKCFIKSLSKDVIFDVSVQILLNGECLFSVLYIEVVKYFYSIWNSTANEPRFQNIIDTISKHLYETANLTQQEYIHRSNEQNCGIIKTSLRYYTWWLYVFYPLLPNSTELILKLIEVVYLDDAQDSLLYGIYHMKKEQLKEFMPHFLNKLERCRCFDPNSVGTGASHQIAMIMNKINSK